MKCIHHDSRSLVAALVRNCRVRVDKVVRRFCCSFLWSSSSLCLSCCRKPWSYRSWKQWDNFPFSSLSKLKQFFFGCCFAACRHGESVEEVLRSEGVRKFAKCLPAFPYTWSFLDRTTLTVRCCSRSFWLRLCDSLRPRRKLSDIDAPACAQRLHVHTHQYPTHSTHTYTLWKRAVLLGYEEGEN